ncbi:hypothetical protein TSMEX_011710, partial [Taenia solium]
TVVKSLWVESFETGESGTAFVVVLYQRDWRVLEGLGWFHDILNHRFGRMIKYFQIHDNCCSQFNILPRECIRVLSQFFLMFAI